MFVMEPLLGGRLAGKLPPRARAVLDDVPVTRICSTPAAWGLSWVWNHPQVTMLLSGMTDTAQVDENSSLADLALPNSMTARPARHDRARAGMSLKNRIACPARDAAIACRALKASIFPGCFAAYNASYAYSWFTGLSQYFTASAVRTKRAQVGEQLRQMRQMRAALPAAHRYSRASRRCAPTFPAWSRDGHA